MDVRWLVVQAAIAFGVALTYVAYNGRQVRLSQSYADRSLALGHHQDSFYYLAAATALLIFFVEVVVHRVNPAPRGALFWLHAAFDAAAVLAVVLACVPYNGVRNPMAHRLMARLFIACAICFSITGGILLYRL